MENVLLLNANQQPIKVITWQRAIGLLLEEKVQLVKAHADRLVRSTSGIVLPWPAVVALKVFVRLSQRARPQVDFKRRNVLARDGYECAYCGARPRTASGAPDVRALSIDHVVPLAQAHNGKVFLPWARKEVPQTCWENVVTACLSCNGRKADRTPEQAGMKLRALPRIPTHIDVVRILIARVGVPEEWKGHIG
jgi:5-methylcytosine-specific restriction endonuclease McrA